MKPRHIFLALLLAFSHANQIVSPPLSPRPSLSPPFKGENKRPSKSPKTHPKIRDFRGPRKGRLSLA